MLRLIKLLGVALVSLFALGVPAANKRSRTSWSSSRRSRRTLTDPALAEFAKYAKERWNIKVKTSALAAGTPVAYGRIVEWKGRPDADIFWGGESALFDKLAEQKLLAKLDLPKGVVDSIPATHRQAQAHPAERSQAVLDRHGAGALRPRVSPARCSRASACRSPRTGTICCIPS